MERRSFQRASILSSASAVPGGYRRSEQRSEPRFSSSVRVCDAQENSVVSDQIPDSVLLTKACQLLLSSPAYHYRGIRLKVKASCDDAAFHFSPPRSGIA